jgi:hypothetical protein
MPCIWAIHVECVLQVNVYGCVEGDVYGCVIRETLEAEVDYRYVTIVVRCAFLA